MSKFVFTEPTRHALATAICEAAEINPNYVRRIVIDLNINHAAVAYVEMLMDDAMLDVNLEELGVKIVGVENGG